MTISRLDDIAMDEVRLTTPVSEADLARLKLGDVVYLDGLLYTAREGVYRKVVDEGRGLPASVVGDVNGDGHPDLVSANTGANTVSVLLGDGTGSFGAKADFATGAVPHSVALADVNGDGHLDLVVANTGADTVSVLLGTGTGSFDPRWISARGRRRSLSRSPI